MARVVKDRFGSDSNFSGFLDEANPIFLLVINLRNAVEHATGEAIIQDYSMDQDGKIWTPSLKLNHDETPLPRVAITNFMTTLTDSLSFIAEGLFAHLCAHHAQSGAGDPVMVTEIPQGKQHHTKVRFGYAVRYGDDIVPFSFGS